jgi:hypothetical protein
VPNITNAKTPEDMPGAVGRREQSEPPDGQAQQRPRWDACVPQGGLAGRRLHMLPKWPEYPLQRI